MKKLVYYLFISVFIVSFSSCTEEEDYKNMNITNYEEEVDMKQLTGDMTGHIVVRNLTGTDVNEVDMGQTFYLIDNTEGGADSRTWTITKGNNTITSDDKFVRLNFPEPGNVSVKLSSVRSSDGESVTSETTVTIKSIPVAVDFITNPAAEGGNVTILQGADVSFTPQLEGSPTIFEWVFDGPETLTSSEQSPTITFIEEGTYNVTFTAKRDDGEEGISEDVIQKEGLIVVEKLEVDLIRAIATGNVIELQYSQPIAQDIPAGTADEYSIIINTASGGTLTPDIAAVTASGDSAIEITFSDQMYSNDEVLLTFNPSGDLKDETGIVTLAGFTNEPCVYGKALAWGDMEDASKWARSSSTASTDGIMAFVNGNSAELAQEPYQGDHCLAIVRGSDKIGVSLLDGFTVNEGDVIEFAYEALTVENVPGALERRMSTSPGDGSNSAGGNWMQAGQNGNGTGEWTTVKKTISVSADTKGQTGTLYFHFFRYGGDSDTAAIWIDNLRIYIPNPRP